MEDKTLFCSKCTNYTKHDHLCGYCNKYHEQRLWNNKCIINEDWFKE